MHASSTLQAHSSLNQPIVHLAITVLIILSGILLLVTVLVVVASIRFRHRAGAGEPHQNFGNPKLEIAWTVLPFLLLVGIFVMTVMAMNVSDPDTTSANGSDPPPDIVAIAHQFWWEIRYPKAGFTTANEFHVPVGQPMLMRLESADVIHDFWVPALGRKMDMIPGHPNEMWLKADDPGTFLGTCAEFCGNEHAWMRIRVIAQISADFKNWEREQAEAPQSPTSSEAQEGAQLFRDMSCSNCHAISGVSSARIGPDLTHIASRETIATGRLNNNPVNLEAWLHDPEKFKPGSYMPNANLQPDELTDMVAYLETLR
ncbi:MAG: cytochrome c oxidase subunit II [Candidatus Sulfotelmatobacter sp.]